MEYIQNGIELLIGFIALLFMTKVLGKNQLSQVTAFDFISALILGELVGNTLYNDEVNIKHILFSVLLWGSFMYVTEWLTQKFRRTRPFLEGGPSIVINKGLIDYDALKKNHLDINQLQLLLRQKGVFSIRECHYAILETNGTVSVMKKSPYDYVTKKDAGITASSPTLPYSIILDGEIVKDNLHIIGWNDQILMNELKKQGISKVEDILYAEWNENEGLYIQPYKDQKK